MRRLNDRTLERRARSSTRYPPGWSYFSIDEQRFEFHLSVNRAAGLRIYDLADEHGSFQQPHHSHHIWDSICHVGLKGPVVDSMAPDNASARELLPMHHRTEALGTDLGTGPTNVATDIAMLQHDARVGEAGPEGLI
jgi:hypothetical protein